MLYVPLDVNFPDDPKVIAAGLEGAGLYAQALCVARRLDTGGVLALAHLERLGATGELLDRLIGADLISVDGTAVTILRWDDILGIGRHIPPGLRRAVFDRDGRACVLCGAAEPLHLDHVRPYSRGGRTTLANLQVLCGPCNLAKGATHVGASR